MKELSPNSPVWPPIARGKGCNPGRAQMPRAFPKRKSQSIPSIRAVSWQCSLGAPTKIEHISLNPRLFEVAFSGIARV